MFLGVAAMVRYLIPALIVLNLVLFGRSMGWLPGLFGDIPDPGRISRQVNPEQIKILPAPPGQPTGNPPSRS
jgi:hypothetical protein